MTLTLRKGWQAFTPHEGYSTYLYPPDTDPTGLYFYVDMDADMVAAYLHGDARYCRVFDTIEEAHAYLVENGSESPWEEV
jgi:hypothetical protein